MTYETQQLAQHILETGKLMRDRIYVEQSVCMNQRSMQKRYGELTQSQLETIRVVRKKGPMGLNDLAGALDISSPSASVMVERLVEKGILIRAHNPQDRRKVLVSISKHALDDILAVEQAILLFFIDLVEKIGPETSHAWSEALEKVNDILKTKPELNKK